MDWQTGGHTHSYGLCILVGIFFDGGLFTPGFSLFLLALL